MNGIQFATQTPVFHNALPLDEFTNLTYAQNKPAMKPLPPLPKWMQPKELAPVERNNDISLNVKMEFHKTTNKPLVKRFANKIAEQISKITNSHDDYLEVMGQVIDKLLKKHSIGSPIALKDHQKILTEDGDVVEIIPRTRGLWNVDEETYDVCMHQFDDVYGSLGCN